MPEKIVPHDRLMEKLAQKYAQEPVPGSMLEFRFYSGDNPSNDPSQAHRWKTVRTKILSTEAESNDGLGIVNIRTTPLQISWYGDAITVERIVCTLFEGNLSAELIVYLKKGHYSSMHIPITILRIVKL